MWFIKKKSEDTVHLRELSKSIDTKTLTTVSAFIIQQIVTMPISGKEALNICHPYMTDILRYT